MQHFVAATDSVVFKTDINSLFFKVILQVNWNEFYLILFEIDILNDKGWFSLFIFFSIDSFESIRAVNFYVFKSGALSTMSITCLNSL
jgi:hypothetical protein